MNKYIVMAVYRCEVNGKAADARDFQSILVKARTSRQAIRKIAGLKLTRYKNTDGYWVKWPLVDIMSCALLGGQADMEEVVGFIAGKAELYGKLSLKKP